MQLLGIEMSLEEFDALMVAQGNGKELKVADNKVVAVEHVETLEEKKEKELTSLINWFNTYFEKQLIQSMWQGNFSVSIDPLFRENDQFKRYANIEALKNQAESVRERIKELRANLTL